MDHLDARSTPPSPAQPATEHDVPSRTGASERILVIRHGAFGDLIQADGALRDIRQHHPDARVSLLVAPHYMPLMARCPHVDELIADPRAPMARLRENLALLERLRQLRFDRVYDLQGSTRTRLYRWTLGITRWSRKHNPSQSRQPDRTAYARQLQRAGMATRHADQPDVGWMADDVSSLLVDAGLRPGYWVLIPGSSARHPGKRWPHFAALAEQLLARGIQVVYAPGPDEMELARQLPGHCLTRGERCLDWFELAGVLRGAAFVIGNDTGPTHLAAGLGRPGLALFGPHTSAARTGIRLGRFEAIESVDLSQLDPAQVLARIPSADLA